MTTTQKGAKDQRRHALLLDLIEHAEGRALRDALAAYEATGDHDHGRGPIRPGEPCNGFLGDDCWVKRAREALAAIEALTKPKSLPMHAQGCPDGGKCHHGCSERCWRVSYCSPLSGTYPDDRWPSAVEAQHQIPKETTT